MSVKTQIFNFGWKCLNKILESILRNNSIFVKIEFNLII